MPSSWLSSGGDTSGSNQETCNFPYSSGTGGVYKSFTDIARILKKHYNPKTLKLLRVSMLVPEIRNLKSQLVISCWP